MTDLLNEYHAIANKLPMEDRHHFNDFFIGALSNHVKDKGWRSSLNTAMGCVEALNAAPAAGPGDQQADKGGSDSPGLPTGQARIEDKQ
jgi:hypothetical protein